MAARLSDGRTRRSDEEHPSLPMRGQRSTRR
jgi:hypothetical protein